MDYIVLDMEWNQANSYAEMVKDPVMPPHYNLQNVFNAQLCKSVRQYSLSAALAMVNEKPYAAHDALNDAMSTALLCSHLDMAKGLQEYQALIEQRESAVERYNFEELYRDIDDVLSDDYVVSFECPDCGGIVWGGEWVQNCGHQLLSVAQCEDGQEFLIKLKLSYTLQGRIRVKRRVYELTEENRLYYEHCVDAAALWSRYVMPACAM